MRAWLDEVEPVLAPEALAVDDEERRAEHALLDCVLGIGVALGRRFRRRAAFMTASASRPQPAMIALSVAGSPVFFSSVHNALSTACATLSSAAAR